MIVEKLEALFLKLHEDSNDSYSNVHVLYKTAESQILFPKTTVEEWPSWLHSHVKSLYSAIKSIVL